ncbi:hypothetical protein [Paraflavitalea pollutisoli]|nr:hypothetical protein [Paraflavitalea sp. H1-2-19X]
MKKLLFAIAVITLITSTSCSRFISPFQAANGKAKCGRGLR